MDWFQHPRFRRVRDDVVRRLKRDVYRFRRLPPVVFLCGARESLPRERLASYMRERLSILVFYAEGVWNVIARHRPDANALEMESQLASLADAVIVVVESPGTFAELGAFALSEELRGKLLPILEVSFRGQNSFLESGPVRWIDRSSHFRPSIWTRQETILQAGAEVEERLRRIPPSKPSEVADLPSSPKHFVFFVADLVSVFGPCSRSHIEGLSEAFLEGGVQQDTGLSLALAAEMGLLKILQVGEQAYYYRPLDNGRLSSFHRTRKFSDVASLRAEVVGAMLTLPGARDLVARLARTADAG